MFLLGSILSHLILAVTLVLAAAVAGLMAYHFARARLRERKGYSYDPVEDTVSTGSVVEQRAKSAEEIAQIRGRIEALMEQQQLRTETQSQHLAQKLDEIRTHMGQQDRNMDGIKNELRHEIHRRNNELDELRQQLAGALDAFWKSMPALPSGDAGQPHSLPPAEADLVAAEAEPLEEASAHEVAARVEPPSAPPPSPTADSEPFFDEGAAAAPEAAPAAPHLSTSLSGDAFDAEPSPPVSPEWKAGEAAEAADQEFSAPTWEPAEALELNVEASTPPTLPPAPLDQEAEITAVAPDAAPPMPEAPVLTQAADWAEVPPSSSGAPEEAAPEEAPSAEPLSPEPATPSEVFATVAPDVASSPAPPKVPPLPPVVEPAMEPSPSEAPLPLQDITTPEEPMDAPVVSDAADAFVADATITPKAPKSEEEARALFAPLEAHLAGVAPSIPDASALPPPAATEEDPAPPAHGPILEAAALPTGEPTFAAPPPPAPTPAPAPILASPETPAPPAAPEPSAAPAEEAPATPTNQGDDLTLISGIDEAIQAKLYAAGVTSLDEMARWGRADARRISRQTGIAEETIMHQWIFEAQSVLFESYQQRMTDAQA